MLAFCCHILVIIYISIKFLLSYLFQSHEEINKALEKIEQIKPSGNYTRAPNVAFMLRDQV